MARRRGGIRARMDRLEGNAHATMNQAQGTIAAIREAAVGLLEDLQDGLTVEIRRTGSIMDFVSGKTDVLPLSIRVVPEEQDAQAQ